MSRCITKTIYASRKIKMTYNLERTDQLPRVQIWSLFIGNFFFIFLLLNIMYFFWPIISFISADGIPLTYNQRSDTTAWSRAIFEGSYFTWIGPEPACHWGFCSKSPRNIQKSQIPPSTPGLLLQHQEGEQQFLIINSIKPLAYLISSLLNYYRCVY